MQLIEPDAVAKIDHACSTSGIAGYQLMSAAGLAVAAAALRHWPSAKRFVVLAGPGNNGGDGYVAANALLDSGASVSIFQFSSAPPSTEDARRALHERAVAPSPIIAYQPEAGDVIVDALFGAGLARDLPVELAALIERVTEAGIPVLAVDMPSGIDGRTGAVMGAAFNAEITITFMAMKPGQLLMPGRDYCGRLEIAGIGVPQRYVEQFASRTSINGPELWAKSDRPKNSASHKYQHGSLVVFSGSASHTGAARLSAEAGLKAGAGLVTIGSPSDAMSTNAAHLTAVMLREIDDRTALDEWLADRRLSAFVLGPGFGIGDKARDYVMALRDRNLVLDADGISSFRDYPEQLFSAFAKGEPHLVLTPHDGEFARIFPDIAADDALSKVQKTTGAAKRAHAVVILKGADTVVASPDGRAAINANAPPWLATAGSGDVLAGICGALLAQGYPAYEAACAAVWHHGEAGNRAGRGLTAETLVSHIDI
ncbi:MAG: Carbohydrate kinase, YjeF related protein [Rhizobium sp.]|nr:Carbohydrate kinase, YjeF related protein [Rhizobium sp.]